jgi:hypothetical protein
MDRNEYLARRTTGVPIETARELVFALMELQHATTVERSQPWYLMNRLARICMEEADRDEQATQFWGGPTNLPPPPPLGRHRLGGALDSPKGRTIEIIATGPHSSLSYDPDALEAALQTKPTPITNGIRRKKTPRARRNGDDK